MEDMEDSRRFLPPKLQTVANSIRKGLEVLEKGGRLRYPRKMVKGALDCAPFVSDSCHCNLWNSGSEGIS